MSNEMDNSNTKPAVAVRAAVFLLLFFAIVFLYDDLKTLPFVQGMSGLVFTLGAAVILFSAVPGKALIKGPIVIGGAAAFFLVALPRIEPFVFPTYTISGTIYY